MSHPDPVYCRCNREISAQHVPLSPKRVTHGRRASHPEYPLERVCSHLSEPFQLTFARGAQQLFREREDVEVVASHRGLTIRAETEEVIDAAAVVLKDLYGPKIRHRAADNPLSPGCHARATLDGSAHPCASDHLEAVNADLIDRNATIDACEIQPAVCVIQACAPLAELMGYRSALEKLTAGSATACDVAQSLCTRGESSS